MIKTETVVKEKIRLIHEELTYKIIGICFKVHTELGCGFPEKIYQKAIIVELRKENLAFVEEKIVKVRYENENIGTFKLDLAIEEKVILELKAIEFIPKIFREKTVSYLKATPYEIALLVNFGKPKLEYERIVRIKNNSNGE